MAAGRAHAKPAKALRHSKINNRHSSIGEFLYRSRFAQRNELRSSRHMEESRFQWLRFSMLQCWRMMAANCWWVRLPGSILVMK